MDVPATVTSKGQVTLPKLVRDALELEAGDRIIFRVLKDRAILAKVPDFLELAGSVPVPAGRRGAAWSKVKAETWKQRTAKRH
ncbi:MAG: AbrB/MazE/SpoVT family DNA-binding domain-containing protein [Actinomycetota bacterium]